MEISVIGVNHRSAPTEVRERFSLPGDLAVRLLRTLRDEKIFEEALVLDTCNRTEVYFVPRSRQDPLKHLLAHIAQLKGASPPSDTSMFYRYDDLEAVTHLFRVAASLDSQIVGESEIFAQVKKAYRLAVEARTARFLLNKLLHCAFHVGKRVRTETALVQGSAGVPQAAVELARRIFSSLEGKTVLLVGAGGTAEIAARNILRAGAGSIIVANRTVSRAEELAAKLLSAPDAMGRRIKNGNGANGDKSPEGCGALRADGHECSLDSAPEGGKHDRAASYAIDLTKIPSVIAEASLVISSTGSPNFVLTYDELNRCLEGIDHPLLMIDIAVPRDIDPRLGELSNVFVYNIDDLDRLVAENIQRRRLEIPKVEAIIRWEVQQFAKWLNSLDVVPTIKLLQRHIRAIQEEEVKRYGKKFCPSDYRELEKFAQSLCNKMLHKPISFLHGLSANHIGSDDLAAVDLFRRMFELDSAEHDE